MVEADEEFSDREKKGGNQRMYRRLIAIVVLTVLVGAQLASVPASAGPDDEWLDFFDELTENATGGRWSTHLFSQLIIDGPHKDQGDQFFVKSSVTNVGSYGAFLVFVHLRNIPAGYSVTPKYLFKLYLGSGKTWNSSFHVVRDSQDSTIYSESWALNAPHALSSRVAVPISPVVTVALSCSFFVLAFVAIRKRRED
jgi:hypothetical protein